MCNVYNMGRSGCYGYSTDSINTTCGYATTTTVNGGWGLFGCGQRLCRDSNGNIRVINSGNSCCNCCCCRQCCCHCGCDNNSGTDNNSGATSGNANGGYGCITVCGVTANAITTANTTGNGDYYARQYGLNGRSGRSSCRCGSGGWSTF